MAGGAFRLVNLAAFGDRSATRRQPLAVGGSYVDIPGGEVGLAYQPAEARLVGQRLYRVWPSGPERNAVARLGRYPAAYVRASPDRGRSAERGRCEPKPDRSHCSPRLSR